MKALVKTKTEIGLELREIPIPKVIPGNVLVKIHAAGVCGSDRHIYEWDAGRHPHSSNVPFILGHEGGGIVEQVSETVSNIEVGDHVAFESHIYDSCSYVQRGLENICPHKTILGIGSDGVFAEYALVPAHIIRKVSKGIPLQVAAIFEPATIGLRALDELSRLHVRERDEIPTVAVLGATGIMGAVAVLAARFYGFSVLALGRDSTKLTLLRSIDSKIRVCNTSTFDWQTEISGVDAVIETTGAESSIELGMKLIAPAGSWIQIGLFSQGSDIYRTLINDVVRRELLFKGVVGRTKQQWQRMTDFVESGALNLSPLITDRYPLEDFEKVFKTKEGIKSIFVME